MKRLLGILTAILLTGTSLVSMSQSATDSNKKPLVSVAQRPTVIPNVQARVKYKETVKAKTQRAVPFNADDSDDDYAQSEDIATGYRRRDLTKIEHEDGISERVRWKLFLARQLALLKYRELHG